MDSRIQQIKMFCLGTSYLWTYGINLRANITEKYYVGKDSSHWTEFQFVKKFSDKQWVT